MRSVGTIAVLSLALSVPMLAHAALSAPLKDASFDSGTLSGMWEATQCDNTEQVGTHLHLSLADGALSARYTDKDNNPDAKGESYNTIFGAINHSSSKLKADSGGSKLGGIAKSYTLSNGIYRLDKGTGIEAATTIQTENGNGILYKIEQVSASEGGEAVSQTFTCHYVRSTIKTAAK